MLRVEFGDFQRFLPVCFCLVASQVWADPHPPSTPLPSTLPITNLSPQCKTQRAVLDHAFANLVGPGELLRSVLVPEAQVVIFAELHYTHSLALEPDLLRSLKSINGKYDCLYVEFSAPSDFIVNDPYLDLVRAATHLGFKVQYVDHLKDAFPDDRNQNTVIRNRGIADEIAKSLANKSCQAGALIIGKGHVSGTDEGMPSVLNNIGVKNQSINLLNLDIEDVRLEQKVGDVYGFVRNPGEVFAPSCPVAEPTLSSAGGFGQVDLPDLSHFSATILVP